MPSRPRLCRMKLVVSCWQGYLVNKHSFKVLLHGLAKQMQQPSLDSPDSNLSLQSTITFRNSLILRGSPLASQASSLSGARMIKKTNRDSFTPGHRNKQTRARLSSVKERVFDYTTPLSCLKLLLCWGEHTKLLPPPIGTETRHSRPRRNPP